MKFVRLSKRDWSILIGNTLEHFDTALYGLIAPVLAPLFFPHHDGVVQLILAYSVFATSLITRPLGALIFGTLASYWPPQYILSLSLMGVALMTAAMGCIPTYASIGWAAPVGLIAIRFLRGICSSGDATIAKIYILEGKARKKALSLSHLYQSFSVLGTILASLWVTCITFTDQPSYYWRFPFWAGALTAILGLFLRGRAISSQTSSALFKAWSPNTFKLLWKERKGVMRIALVTNVSWLTYSIPFVFLNTFVPLVTTLTLAEMMVLNTIFLGIDMVLIPFFGELTKRFQMRQVMGVCALVLGVTLIPLFYFLPQSSLYYVTFVRSWIVIWGIIYLCPLHVFYLDQFKGNHKYLLIGMGNALSAATVGRLTPAICLFIWHQTGYVWASAIYVALFFLVAVMIFKIDFSLDQRRNFF